MAGVGERIRKRRVELGWTQEELCQRAGISKGFLSDLENDKRSVSAENLLDIARALSLSLDYLMTGKASRDLSGRTLWTRSISRRKSRAFARRRGGLTQCWQYRVCLVASAAPAVRG